MSKIYRRLKERAKRISAYWRERSFRPLKRSSVEDTIKFKRIKGRRLAPMPCMALVVVEGPDQGREFLLYSAPIKIGRGADNYIRLRDSGVSREHGLIRYDPATDGFFLTDLGSKNGTYVNNLRIKKKRLSPGDEIKVGESVFRVVSLE